MSKFLTPMDAELRKPVPTSAPGADLNSGGHVYTWESGGGTLMNLLAPSFPEGVLAAGQFSGNRTSPGTIAGRKYSGNWEKAPSREPDSDKGSTSARSIAGTGKK